MMVFIHEPKGIVAFYLIICKKCECIGSFNFVGNQEIGYYKSKKYPDGKYCLVLNGEYEGEETGERFTIDIDYCPWCGEKLDLEDI